MNDTHKLLLAFIEASGFDVEKVTDYQETEILAMEGRGIIELIQYGIDKSYQFKTHNGEYVRGANSEYIRMLKNPIVDYKVTIKEPDNTCLNEYIVNYKIDKCW